jgi:hypothetical protein
MAAAWFYRKTLTALHEAANEVPAPAFSIEKTVVDEDV